MTYKRFALAWIALGLAQTATAAAMPPFAQAYGANCTCVICKCPL